MKDTRHSKIKQIDKHVNKQRNNQRKKKESNRERCINEDNDRERERERERERDGGVWDSVAHSRPFRLVVSPFWSIFSRGPKRFAFSVGSSGILKMGRAPPTMAQRMALSEMSHRSLPAWSQPRLYFTSILRNALDTPCCVVMCLVLYNQ